MKAGRFTADELRRALDEFRVPAELGGELMTVHFEFVPLYARWRTLTAQKNDLRQGNLVRGREIDREWHAGQEQRVQERDEVIADQIRRRSEASKAFGAARSEAKTAANKTAVAERRLAGGRGGQEELDQAREAQRRAEQATVDAKAELDRVDARIKEEKEQRRLRLSAPNRERAANRDRADEFEAAANSEIAAIELRCEALREWHRRLRLAAARLNNHYVQERHAEHARRANASIEAAHRRNMEIAREQAEKAGLDRDLALAGLDFALPTVPAVPVPDPVQPEVEGAIRELRGRYAPRRAEEFDRERPESPTIGFSLPAQEEGSVNPEVAEEPGTDDVPLSPPPIGFSFPPPTP